MAFFAFGLALAFVFPCNAATIFFAASAMLSAEMIGRRDCLRIISADNMADAAKKIVAALQGKTKAKAKPKPKPKSKTRAKAKNAKPTRRAAAKRKAAPKKKAPGKGKKK